MKRAVAVMLCIAMFISGSFGVSAEGTNDTVMALAAEGTEVTVGDTVTENQQDIPEDPEKVLGNQNMDDVQDEIQEILPETDTFEEMSGFPEDPEEKVTEEAETPEEEATERSEEPEEEITEIPEESDKETEEEPEGESEEADERAEVSSEDMAEELEIPEENAELSENPEWNTDLNAELGDGPDTEQLEETVEMETVMSHDTMDDAQVISMGSKLDGAISEVNEQDYYTFTLGQSSSVTIKGTYHMSAVCLYLYDENGKELWNSIESWNATTQWIAQNAVFHLEAGRYYYRVREFSSFKGDGNYDFTVTSVSTNESFAEVRGGSNNAMSTASRIYLNRNYKGQLSLNDFEDYYIFTLDQSGCVSLKATYNLNLADVCIYNEKGETVWNPPSLDWNKDTKQAVQNVNLHLTSGTYYYHVKCLSGSRLDLFGTYDFTLSFTSAGESFAEPQGGNNNKFASANGIDLATTYKGQIAWNDDVDIYRVVIPQNGKYLLSLTAYMERIRVHLYDKEGNSSYNKFPSADAGGQCGFSDVLSLSEGTYYLKLEKYGYGYCGNYQFQFSNRIQTGWQKINGKWYYYNDSGVRQTGWLEIDGYWYYMNADGVMQTGWTKVGGTWYYLGSNGVRRTDWQKVSGKWYYMNSRGEMQTGWTKVSGKWYCLNSKGEMQTGWKRINGKWYCMSNSGVMQTGWTKVSGKWYYLNSSGVMQTGWTKVGRSWYCLNSSGVMQTGWHKINGKWYCMSNSGVMQTGWTKVGGKWYYMNSSGVMQTGWVKISGKWYYMNQNGVWTATR